MRCHFYAIVAVLHLVLGISVCKWQLSVVWNALHLVPVTLNYSSGEMAAPEWQTYVLWEVIVSVMSPSSPINGQKLNYMDIYNRIDHIRSQSALGAAGALMDIMCDAVIGWMPT